MKTTQQVHTNNILPAARSPQPAAVDLSTAQRRHLTRLIRVAEAAEMAIKEAERNRDVAIANANGYVGYLAEEHGVDLGIDPSTGGGWAFDQDDLRFVRGAAGGELRAAGAENGNGNE